MKRSGFSARLSWKIILITSCIFILSLVVIAVRGSRMTYESAVNYTEKSLSTSIARIESSISDVEQMARGIASTFEAVQHQGAKLDTSVCFDLIRENLSCSPHILGMGFYFEPKVYNRRNRHAGIYISRDLQTGATETEWDDDAIYAVDGWSYFEEEWYIQAIKEGSPLWISPFLSFMEDGSYKYMTTYSFPLKDRKGKCFGVFGVDMSLEWLQASLLSMRPYPGSDVVLVDDEKNFICNPLSDKPFEGKITPDLEVAVKNETFVVQGDLENGWRMIITNKYTEAFSSMISLWVILSVIALLGLIVIFFLVRYSIRRETKPLVAFADAASCITDGHFDVPIPALKHNDEISDLGNALDFMQKSVTNYIEELKTTTAEKERLSSELDVAKNIQVQMLRYDFPKMAHCGFHALSKASREVGGDLYDFYIRGDELFFILGDVSGKGVPAALLMAISIAAFRACSQDNHSVSRLVSRINDTFCSSSHDMMFITLVAGRINTVTGEMEFCNAGHNPMVLVTPDGKASFIQAKANLVCGIMEGFQYEGESMKMEKGSRLFIYSDGITESENRDHGQYGEDRLLDVLTGCTAAAQPEDKAVLDGISASVAAFVDGAEQFDDMTMMSISLPE